jgi:hypothetical protein
MLEGEKDNDEILPYLFMADAVRYMIKQYVAAEDGSTEHEELRAIAQFLGERFEADEQTRAVILTSFIESMPYPDEEGSGLVSLLPGNLKRELNLQRGTVSKGADK